MILIKFCIPVFHCSALRCFVSTDKLTIGSKSPDNAGNPPSENSAGSSNAKDEAHAAFKRSANLTGEGDNAGNYAGGNHLDETPDEPNDETVMHVHNFSGLCSLSGFE